MASQGLLCSSDHIALARDWRKLPIFSECRKKMSQLSENHLMLCSLKLTCVFYWWYQKQILVHVRDKEFPKFYIPFKQKCSLWVKRCHKIIQSIRCLNSYGQLDSREVSCKSDLGWGGQYHKNLFPYQTFWP